MKSMDFTLAEYNRLLNTLLLQGFSFQTFADFISRPANRTIIMRHDVDKLPKNSLEFAKTLSELRINGTFYFRTVLASWDEKIVMEISEMGHEVGYHYEDVNLAAKRQKAKSKLKTDLQDRKSKRSGDPASAGTARQKDNGHLEKKLVDIAINSFAKNLQWLREIVPVKTICMHGSPMSRWDSRLLWKYYDYRDFGIIGEPYFDVDFDEVMYLTDTGRRWDGEGVSVRDKAIGSRLKAEGEEMMWRRGERENGREEDLAPRTAHRVPFQKFHSTFDIIKAAEEGRLPDKMMMTFHPQRWTDKPMPWVKELVWQNVKNGGKFFLVKIRD